MKKLITIYSIVTMVLAISSVVQAGDTADGQYAWYYSSGNVYPESNAEMVYALSLTQPAPGSDAYTTIQRAGDFLIWAQNNDGGWDWTWNIEDPKPGNSSWNEFGIVAKGLIGAYNTTNDSKYLNAAKKTADALKNSIAGGTFPTNGWPLYQDCWFLYEYAEASGDSSYRTAADDGLAVSVRKYSTFSDIGRGGADNDPTTIAHGMFQRYQIVDSPAPSWGTDRYCNGYDSGGALLGLDMATSGLMVDVDPGVGEVLVSMDAIKAAFEAEMQSWVDSDAGPHPQGGKWYRAADTTYGTDLVLNQGAALIALVRSMEGDKTGGDYLNYIGPMASELAACITDGYFWWNPATHGESADADGGYQAHAYALMGIAEYNNLGSYPSVEEAAVAWAVANHTYVPEPATIALLGLGALSLLRRKK